MSTGSKSLGNSAKTRPHFAYTCGYYLTRLSRRIPNGWRRPLIRRLNASRVYLCDRLRSTPFLANLATYLMHIYHQSSAWTPYLYAKNDHSHVEVRNAFILLLKRRLKFLFARKILAAEKGNFFSGTCSHICKRRAIFPVGCSTLSVARSCLLLKVLGMNHTWESDSSYSF